MKLDQIKETPREIMHSLQGTTPVDHILFVPGKRISAISAISSRGVEDVYLVEESVNGDIFCDFVIKCLLPILEPCNGVNSRSIVVLDNASIHHLDRVYYN